MFDEHSLWLQSLTCSGSRPVHVVALTVCWVNLSTWTQSTSRVWVPGPQVVLHLDHGPADHCAGHCFIKHVSRSGGLISGHSDVVNVRSPSDLIQVTIRVL